MALVLLYRTKVKPGTVDKLSRLRESFQKIYREYGIEILGHWQEVEDETVHYYMTSYTSAEDYEDKVKIMHEDERYVKLASELNEIRTDFKIIKMTPH